MDLGRIFLLDVWHSQGKEGPLRVFERHSLLLQLPAWSKRRLAGKVWEIIRNLKTAVSQRELRPVQGLRAMLTIFFKMETHGLTHELQKKIWN